MADNRQMDRVSSTGYGMGYLGGVVVFIIFLVAELSKGFSGLLSSYGVARFSFGYSLVDYFCVAVIKKWSSTL